MLKRRIWILDPRICWTVLFAFCCLSLVPVNARASLVESRLADSVTVSERAAQIETIRQALEQQVVAQRLADYGFTPQEVAAKLPTLSDEQLHQMAGLSEDLAAGSDALGVVVALLVIVLLVVVIVKLMDKEIVIK